MNIENILKIAEILNADISPANEVSVIEQVCYSVSTKNKSDFKIYVYGKTVMSISLYNPDWMDNFEEVGKDSIDKINKYLSSL